MRTSTTADPTSRRKDAANPPEQTDVDSTTPGVASPKVGLCLVDAPHPVSVKGPSAQQCISELRECHLRNLLCADLALPVLQGSKCHHKTVVTRSQAHIDMTARWSRPPGAGQRCKTVHCCQCFVLAKHPPTHSLPNTLILRTSPKMESVAYTVILSADPTKKSF